MEGVLVLRDYVHFKAFANKDEENMQIMWPTQSAYLQVQESWNLGYC